MNKIITIFEKYFRRKELIPTNNSFIKTRSPFFLFIFTNIKFLIICVIAWLLFWIYVSNKYANWDCLSRSGSLLIMVGSILIFRNTIRLTREERVGMRNMTIIQIYTPLEKADQEKDSQAIILGTILVVLGTIIWAYGDLFGFLIK